MSERTLNTAAAQREAELTPHADLRVDLRSDTVTKPTPAMREAMAAAEVGDDVYGEDPTVNRLQARAAEIFEREAALFVPSGSMGNLLAIMNWAAAGTEIICEQRAHTNQYELASLSAIAGCFPRTTLAPDGILTWDHVESLLRPKAYLYSQTGLVWLENTHNMAGGTIHPQESLDEICERTHALGLPIHLDGARIFNASVATGKSVAQISRKFDSVMFCLSKGLGAPVGSLLLGSRDFIQKTHVKRKMLGGAMRQAGILAAAGLIALEESPKLLRRDHENARLLAEGLAGIKGITLDVNKVVTNIVIFDVRGTGKNAAEISSALAKRQIFANPTEKFLIRVVTHCDVDRAACERALKVLGEVATQA